LKFLKVLDKKKKKKNSKRGNPVQSQNIKKCDETDFELFFKYPVKKMSQLFLVSNC